MAEVLELAELAQDDRMAEVQIGTAGVAAELDVEGRVGGDGAFDLAREVFFAE